MAEKYYLTSPYAYTLNNPVRYIDPTRNWVEDFDTKYLNQQGELLYETQDGLTDIIIADGNISRLEKKLNESDADGTLGDPIFNRQEMRVLGQTPREYTEEKTKGDYYWVKGYKETYDKAYQKGARQFSLGQIFSSFVASYARENKDESGSSRHAGRSMGIMEGNYDRKNGKINRLNPHSSFKNTPPMIILKCNSHDLI